MAIVNFDFYDEQFVESYVNKIADATIHKLNK